MDKKKKIALITADVMKKKPEKTTYRADDIEPVTERKRGFYEKYIKRVVDIVCATGAIVVFAPLYIGVAALVKLKLGSPVLFTQDRPGQTKDGKETIFKMYKFRTMTDERDENGKLLPDEARLTKFGKWLRSTSLDELPEAFNILNGTMSVIGPRPQLIRDMVFMSKEQRMRHTSKPGLSGLAQVNGRNSIDWEDKLDWDLKYIEKIEFISDLKIIIDTVGKAFVKREGITVGAMATAEDFGDYLLIRGKVSREEYDNKQVEAKRLLNSKNSLDSNDLVSIITPSYNTDRFIGLAIKSVQAQTYTNWEMIIVDDCSSDNTDLVVEPYLEDKRIRFFRNSKNCGAAVSRNSALREVNGRWIAFLDSDDLWEADKLEKQIRFMEKNKCHFSYTKYEEIDEDSGLLRRKVSGPRTIGTAGIYTYCWPGCLTVMYDRSVVGDIQIADIKKNNDYAMWLKVSKKAECHLLPEVLAQYRKRTGSISNHSYKELIKWHYKLYREADDKNAFVAGGFTMMNLVFGVMKKILYVKNY